MNGTPPRVPPDANIRTLDFKPRSFRSFDVKAARTQKVDCHIGNNGCFPDYIDISLLRKEVERFGRLAITRASHRTKQIDDAREAARRVKRVLDKVDRDIRWLRAREIEDVSWRFIPKDKRDEVFRAVETPLDQIIENLKSLHEWTEVLNNHFAIKSPNEKRSKFLAHHFVELMLDLYSHWTGKIAPKSGEGPFVRFLVAAWGDLCFPKLPYGTLATMAERLPRLTKKIIR